MGSQQFLNAVRVSLAVTPQRIAFRRIAFIQKTKSSQLHHTRSITTVQLLITVHRTGIRIGHVTEIIRARAPAGHLAHDER